MRSDVTAALPGFGQDQLAPACHFERGTPGEGQQQQALRMRPLRIR